MKMPMKEADDTTISEQRDGEKYHDDSDDTSSLRQYVFRAYRGNLHITAKPIMKELNLCGKSKEKVINNYLSEARHIITNLAYPKNPKLHKRTFVWENVSRALLFERFPRLKDGFVRALGWELVANRNRMLKFKHDLGSVHWYENGTAVLYLRGEAPLARAKELFSKAFHFLSDDDLCRFLDAQLRETDRHWVFETGQKLPRFDIRHFERSHGLRIKSNGSHPTGVEIHESEPFWLGKLDNVVDKFGIHLDTHKLLVESLAKESNTRTRIYEADFERTRRQDNSLVAEGRFQRFCNWLNKDVSSSIERKGLVSQ